MPKKAKSLDRFTIKCPECGVGGNSRAGGGNANCFHCNGQLCGYVECAADFDLEGNKQF